MKLDKTVVETLKKPINATWNYIGSDVYEMCDGDNECALEMCIDADRLTTCGNDASATTLVRDLIKEHGYAKVLKFLSRNFRFV
jgi:hypothetical protein